VALSSPDPTTEVVGRLRAAGCVFAEEEAALVLAEAEDAEQMEAMLVRRVSGEPLEQVLGWAEFCGLRVRVTPGVFVPRRRTAFLVHLALHDPESRLASTRSPVVADLCCGTGAVGLAIAAGLDGDVDLHAADVDPDAVACARLNVTSGEVHEGDLYDALPSYLLGRVDLLAVNAPYVPTDQIALMPPEAREHEHRIALDGGADGLDLHRRVAGGARPWLAPGGVLLLETSRPQAEATKDACRRAGLPARICVDEEAGATVVRAISVGAGSSGRMTR